MYIHINEWVQLSALFSTCMCHKCGQQYHDLVSLSPGVLVGGAADEVTRSHLGQMIWAYSTVILHHWMI